MSDCFGTPWTIAHHVPLSIRFPGQEYWSELPFPSPRDLPDPGTEPTSPALAGGFFTTEPPGKPQTSIAEGKLENHKYRKVKQCTLKIPMNQRRNHSRN